MKIKIVSMMKDIDLDGFGFLIENVSFINACDNE